MPDGQSQKKDEDKEKLQVDTDKEAQERKDAREKRERERGKTKEKSVQRRTGGKLEQLEEGSLYYPDTKTPRDIAAIRADEVEKKEMESNLELLSTVSVTILAKLFDGGIKFEEVNSLEGLRNVLNRVENEPRYKKLKTKLSSLTENATLKKLKDVISDPSTELYKKLNAKWSTLQEQAKKIYEDANDGITGKLSKSVEWIKENPAKAALLAVGAFALYSIVMSEKKEGKGKKTGLVLGVVAIGAILGSEKVRDWIKKTLIGNAKEIAERSVNKAKEAATNWLNKKINFDETKERLLQHLPKAPGWLKTAKFKDVIGDMGINPEQTTTWQEYQGPGGAALLLYHWMTRKRKVDGATAKIIEKFVEKEKKRTPEKPSESSEYHPEYGAIVPLKDAWGNYKKDLSIALKDFKQWIRRNNTILAGAAIYAGSIDTVRSTFLRGLQGGATGFVDLAKLPVKAIKGFPITSLFAVSAIILGGKTLTGAAGDIMVPKDAAGLKKYVKYKFQQGGERLKDLPPIPDEHIDTAIDIITTPGKLWKYMAPVGEMIQGGAEKAAGKLALSPKEQIQATNIEGLLSFAEDLEELEYKQKSGLNDEQKKKFKELITEARKLHISVKNGTLLKNEALTEELNKYTSGIGIKILLSDGFIVWTHSDPNVALAIANGPFKIGIDSTLDEDDAIYKSNRFTVGSGSFWDNASKPIDVLFDSSRRFLDRAFFKDAETPQEAGKLIESKLRNPDTYLTWNSAGAWMYEVKEGVVHKLWLGPGRLIKQILWEIPGAALSDKKEFSYMNAAVDYAEGLFPVLIMGITANMAKLRPGNILTKRFLLRTTIYPVTGTLDIYKFSKNFYANYDSKNPNPIRSALQDPKLSVTRNFQAFWMRRQSGWIANNLGLSFASPEVKKAILSERIDLGHLYEAESYLRQSKIEMIGKKDLLEKAQKAIQTEGTVLSGSSERITTDKKTDEVLKLIDERRIQRENLVNNMIATEKANYYLEKGKIAKANKALGEKGLSEKALKEKIRENRSAIEAQKADINPEDKAKPKPKEKLKGAEKKAAIEDLKKAKEEITKKAKDYGKKVRELKERATANGKRLSDPTVRQEINTMKQELAVEIKSIHTKHKISAKMSGLDDATLREHGFDPEVVRKRNAKMEELINVPTSKKGKIKNWAQSGGKSILTIAITIAAMYGLSKGIAWFHGEGEKLDLDKLYAKETKSEKKKRETEVKKMEDDPELEKEIMTELFSYAEAIERDYTEVNAIIGDPKKLKETPDEKLIPIVNKAAESHKTNIKNLKKFFEVNRDAFITFHKRFPKKFEKDIPIGSGQFFAIGWEKDKNRPYLKYADESDFKEIYYETADMYREFMDELLAGKEIGTWEQAKYVAGYAAPGYGTYLDGKDCYEAIKRGETWSAVKSGGWTLLGGVSDALMVAAPFTIGTSAAAGAALRGVRFAAGGTKAAAKSARAASIIVKLQKAQKTLKALKTSGKISAISKTSNVAMSVGIGADIGRQVFVPPKSQTYYF